MKTWRGLINNTEANELYDLLGLAYNNRASDDEKKRVIVLTDLLNNEGFSDEIIEQFIDWKGMNAGLNKVIENVIGGQG